MRTSLSTVQTLALTFAMIVPGILNAATPNKALQNAIGDQNIASFWTYDNLELAKNRARETQKPLLVTIRCVPCHACRGMDQQIINPSDPKLLALMNQFVCVRIVQAWGLDLSLFQYDMNQSWAAFMINAEGTIYGRYGTRAAQRNDKAITVEGFSKALDGAIDLHRQYLVSPESTKQLLAGKTGPQQRWQKPEEIPVIQNTTRWGKPLGKMTGNQQAECLHCHFVPAADMMSMLDAGARIPDQTLWAYPLPETVGWTFDPLSKATLSSIRPHSQADRAGFQSGDAIQSLNGQPILSIADIQWVLHQAQETDSINAIVKRDQSTEELTINLQPGWRRRDEFVSRVSSWDFFKVKLFGVTEMTRLSDDERKEFDLEPQQTALRVIKLAPNWGGMNRDVRKAGLKEGDIIVGVDDTQMIRDHSELLAYLVQHKKSGQQLKLEVIRSEQRVRLNIPLEWSDRLRALRKP